LIEKENKHSFNGRVKGSKVIKRITNPLAETQQIQQLKNGYTEQNGTD
jgi:hypothetical protein